MKAADYILRTSPQLRDMADATADAMRRHVRIDLQPRVAELLVQAAELELRRASGQDVTTAAFALEASFGNLAREERALFAIEGRNLALRAAVAVVAGLLGVA